MKTVLCSFARVGVAAIALLAFGGVASAQYRCTVNPAICIAICGSNPCKDNRAQADIQKLELVVAPSRGRAAATPAAAGGGTRLASGSYTCSNPAICNAVCGKPTCP